MFENLEKEINDLFASNPSSIGLEQKIKRIFKRHGVTPDSTQIRKMVNDYKKATGN